MGTKNSPFLALTSDAGICEEVPKPVSASLLIDALGYWSVNKLFSATLSAYTIIWSDLSQTNSQYRSHVREYKNIISAVSAQSTSSNLAKNLLYHMAWAHVDSKTGTRINFNGYPQSIFDRKTHFASLGNSTDDCDQRIKAEFNPLSGVMTLSVDESLYSGSASCVSKGDSADVWGYDSLARAVNMEIKYDTRSLMLAHAVNEGVFAYSSLTRVPNSRRTLTTTYRGANYSLEMKLDSKYV